MQTLGSVQSTLNTSNNSLFSDMLGQVLQEVVSIIQLLKIEIPCITMVIPLFLCHQTFTYQNEHLLNAIASYPSSNSMMTSDFDDIIKRAAKKYNVPEKLISSVIKQESNFDPSAQVLLVLRD